MLGGGRFHVEGGGNVHDYGGPCCSGPASVVACSWLMEITRLVSKVHNVLCIFTYDLSVIFLPIIMKVLVKGSEAEPMLENGNGQVAPNIYRATVLFNDMKNPLIRSLTSSC